MFYYYYIACLNSLPEILHALLINYVTGLNTIQYGILCPATQLNPASFRAIG